MHKTKKKILFVLMQNSPHSMKWVRQALSADWEIHLFPISTYELHPQMPKVKTHWPFIISLRNNFNYFLDRYFCYKNLNGKNFIAKVLAVLSNAVAQRLIALNNLLFFYISQLFLKWHYYINPKDSIDVHPWCRSKRLAKVINKIKPDLVHSLEFQHCGYITLGAKDLYKKKFPTWAISCWGSDLFFFKDFREHLITIKKVLSNVNFFFAECERDIKLAKELGYKGEFMPLLPASGGFNINLVSALRNQYLPSERKIILVKGYQTFAGRALTSLNILNICKEDLVGFNILVYSATPETRKRIEELNTLGNINITVLEQLPYIEMLEIFSRARIYMGISISDGISASMLDAIALGAFPIQTNTSCCEEWIRDGISGFIIPHNDELYVADRLRDALLNDELVNSASELNWLTVKNRLNEDYLMELTQEAYKKIFQNKLGVVI